MAWLGILDPVISDMTQVMPLDDNAWTSGQFIAIILLVIPWLTLLGDLWGKSSTTTLFYHVNSFGL